MASLFLVFPLTVSLLMASLFLVFPLTVSLLMVSLFLVFPLTVSLLMASLFLVFPLTVSLLTVSPLTFSLLMVSDPFFRLSMIDLSVTTDLSHSIALLNLTGCFVLTVLYLCSVQPELSELSDLQTYFESLAVSSELPSCLHHLSFASQSFFLPRFHRSALPYQP